MCYDLLFTSKTVENWCFWYQHPRPYPGGRGFGLLPGNVCPNHKNVAKLNINKFLMCFYCLFCTPPPLPKNLGYGPVGTMFTMSWITKQIFRQQNRVFSYYTLL